MSGSLATSPSNIYRQYMGIPTDPHPEDIEEIDRQNLQAIIDEYFDNAYPPFEPQIVTRVVDWEAKEYFLPALKVLKFVDGNFYSPSNEVLWKDGELKAECRGGGLVIPNFKYVKSSNGNISAVAMDKPVMASRHDAPDESCDCGIYGSVNLEEILEYMSKTYMSVNNSISYRAYYLGMFDEELERAVRSEPKNVLCLIEPSPDAKVIMCRKGWKASHAFISEIVEETISLSDTSQILSLAWQRNIDLDVLDMMRRNR